MKQRELLDRLNQQLAAGVVLPPPAGARQNGGTDGVVGKAFLNSPLRNATEVWAEVSKRVPIASGVMQLLVQCVLPTASAINANRGQHVTRSGKCAVMVSAKDNGGLEFIDTDVSIAV